MHPRAKSMAAAAAVLILAAALFLFCDRTTGLRVSRPPVTFAESAAGFSEAQVEYQTSARQLSRSGSAATPAEPGDVNQGIVERRIIEPDLDLIRNATSTRLELDTGDGVPIVLLADRVQENAGGGVSVSGGLEGFPNGSFFATIHQSALVLDVRTRDPGKGDWFIQKSPARGHELRRMNWTVISGCDGAEAPSQTEAPVAADETPGPEAPEPPLQNDDPPPIANDEATTIDVMIVYTPSARLALGGTDSIIASMNQAVNEANSGLAASQVASRFRLVHYAEVNYTESDDGSLDLTELRTATDGEIDEVHTMRNENGADLVSLWTTGGYSGTGYVMTTLSNQFQTNAFSVCNVFAAVGGYTFAHEISHNLGCGHEGSGSPSLLSYSHGWRWFGSSGNEWRSVMAYAPGIRILQWSNPAVKYDGVNTGDTSKANNAQTVRDATPVATNWRNPAPVNVSPPLNEAPAKGGNFSFQVSTASASGMWTWGSSGGDWMTTTELESQTGSQTFSYTLAENHSQDSRTVTITVTYGFRTRTHIIRQAGKTADLSLEPPAANVKFEGDDGIGIRVIAGAAWTWQVSEPWVTVNAEAELPAGEKILRYDVSPNPSLFNRVATITVTCGGAVATHFIRQAGDASDDHGNQRSTATNMSLNSSMKGQIESSGDYDYFRIVPTEPGIVYVWATGDVKLNCWILKETGSQLHGGYAPPGETFPKFGFEPDPVAYYIWLFPSEGSRGDYELHVEFKDGMPDLYYNGSFSTTTNVRPNYMRTGDSVLINNVSVNNKGQIPSGPFTVRLYFSSDNIITPEDYVLGEIRLGSLGAKKSVSPINIEGVVPLDTPAGAYHCGFIIDADNEVTEISEEYNTAVSSTAYLTVAGPQLIKTITQSLPNGTTSSWTSSGSHLTEARLTLAAGGLPGNALEEGGRMTPPFAMSPLTAKTSAGPLQATGKTGNLRLNRTVRLVQSQHATDDEITFINDGVQPESVTMDVTDLYGGAGHVHYTSSGDTAVSAADLWFVVGSPGNPDAAGDIPAMLISWTVSPGPALISFPSSPDVTPRKFSTSFAVTLPPKQKFTLGTRREVFSSPEKAKENAWPAPPLLSLSRAEQDVPAAAGLAEVTVYSTSSWQWQVNQPWVTALLPDSTAQGTQIFVCRAEQNDSFQPRTALITFTVPGYPPLVHTLRQSGRPLRLAIQDFARQGSDITLSFVSEFGVTYKILTCSDLETGLWTEVSGQPEITGTGSVITRTLTGAGDIPEEGRRYFRVAAF